MTFKLEDLEKKLSDLPTLPMVAHHLNVESQKDTFTSKILAGIIEKDPPLTSKILKLANSAYYGFSSKVASLDRAITMLGFGTVKNLACSVAISSFFPPGQQGEVDMGGLWKHCLGTAVSARQLIMVTAPALAEEAFLAGVLHDIGTIIIINKFPDQALAALRVMKEKKISQSEAEKGSIGFTHEAAGAFLVSKWNFPPRFYRIIRMHHNPPPQVVATDDAENLLLMAVYAGNQLSKALGLGKSLEPVSSGVMPTAWKSLGVDPAKLREVKELIQKDFEVLSHEWL
ncbi:MAG: HDOD domain-containing protein [Desulfobulbaceae bacterium]|nr:HDOD domain-containing protein [Desulfobulbaceae bacterium]